MRAFPMEIRGFADTFIDWQKVRRQADYALEDEYSKRDVLARIDTVEGATARFGESRLPHGDERRAAPEAGFVEVDGTEVVRIPFVVQTTKPPPVQ